MSNYRRVYIPGGCYFFTVVILNRVPIFTAEASIDLVRQALRKTMAKRPFHIDAMVILPEHLHFASHSLQSGQTWLDHKARRLAVVVFQAGGCQGLVR